VAENAPTINRRRYRHILFFWARVIAHLVWWDLLLGRVFLFRPRVLASRPERFRRLARRFRGLAVEMGGVLIKLGQFLSSRVDVLPVEITGELTGLQDEVPPVAWAEIRAVIRAELGDPADHFAAFEETPQAAASLGQAHRARLLPSAAGGRFEPGPAVVVKVQRPGIDVLVQTDLSALRVVARWAMRYGPIRRRANVPALLEEFSRTLWEELDYRLEAEHAERMAQIFAGDAAIVIPGVFREHSTSRVLVLENVEGIKITDVAQMREAGIDPAEVAERLLDAYFGQIFGEGFFHADPHPGNLFVLEGRPAGQVDGEEAVTSGGRPFRLAFVDFGMMGRIDPRLRENLRTVLVSATQRDARSLTMAYNAMGFFLPGSDLERIAEAQATLLDHMWGRKLLELSRPDPREVEELGREFRDILFDFPFQIPQDFIYLGRTLGMLSGLASQLDPEINPWRQIEKFGRELIAAEGGRRLGREAVLEWLRPLVSLPSQLERFLGAAESGRLRVQTTPDRQTIRRLDRLERQLNQIQWSVLAGAAVLAGALFYLDGARSEALVAWGTAGLLLAWSLLRRR
jgi:predicted unusual protein kinase regulating ubiquinone biosynthesis (AarF/ABC1/UbiB family)